MDRKKDETFSFLKLSEIQISELVNDIKAVLKKWNLEQDVSFYFNGIKSISKLSKDGSFQWRDSYASPEDYCKYVAKDHILTMFFEGHLYELISLGEDFSMKQVFTLKEEVTQQYMQALGVDKLITSFRKVRLSDLVDELEWIEPLDFQTYDDYLNERFYKEAEWEKEISIEIYEKNLHNISDMARNEFYEVFKKYYVWFEFGERWSLTCFQDQNNEYLNTEGLI